MGHQDEIHTDRLGLLMDPVSIVKVFSDDPEKIKKHRVVFQIHRFRETSV